MGKELGCCVKSLVVGTKVGERVVANVVEGETRIDIDIDIDIDILIGSPNRPNS